ncbi:MAG: UDP-N-acetylglucosamine--N-acetylmuramyl-(pentapeptide) pyrophosphoryl-undecaprenol N-acetylglucosamine transferase [Candidatus Actinomarina sp.]|jgi:UDP-N-acetylglucosamine:LPS N-acetylglucosamine transferase
MNQNKIMFFCVGTGGHVLPVKNIIDELLNSGISKNQIEIVTDNRGSKFLQEVDVKCYTTDVFRSDIGKLGYLINLTKIFKTISNINKNMDFKNTKIIFTTGSYIAPIAAYLSWRKKIKLFVQEQNIYTGLGNKIASYFKSTVFASYPDTKNVNQKNVEFVGPVIDKKIKKSIKDINDNIVIGVQGGSQGSNEINNFVYKYLENHKLIKIKILHIVGPSNIDKSKNFNNYEQLEYVDNMNDFYQQIDVQISRAGGGILEALYLNIPLILIPYKLGTTSSHQQMNAKFLVDNEYAIICNNYTDVEKEILLIDNENTDWLDKYKVNNTIESGNISISKKIIQEIKNGL